MANGFKFTHAQGACPLVCVYSGTTFALARTTRRMRDLCSTSPQWSSLGQRPNENFIASLSVKFHLKASSSVSWILGSLFLSKNRINQTIRTERQDQGLLNLRPRPGKKHRRWEMKKYRFLALSLALCLFIRQPCLLVCCVDAKFKKRKQNKNKKKTNTKAWLQKCN